MVDVLTNYWYPVMRSSDVWRTPVGETVLDRPIVFFRVQGEVVALDDLCIHRGTPLSLGWLDQDELVCAYHGWRYGSDGRCVRIPSLPEGKTIPRKARVRKYRTEERYGMVWICLSDDPALPIPPYPFYDDETVATVLYEPFRWKANAARVVENILDFTHLPWVHNGLLGSREYPVYPHVTPEACPDGMAYDVPDERNGTVRQYRVYTPLTVALALRTTGVPGVHGLDYSLLFTCCPVSSKETIQSYFSSRDSALPHPDNEWAAFDDAIMEQDRVIVEAQRPEELPLDLTEELHLRGTDAGGLAYRKLLGAIGVDWKL